jgi:hypothetical protein
VRQRQHALLDGIVARLGVGVELGQRAVAEVVTVVIDVAVDRRAGGLELDGVTARRVTRRHGRREVERG